jgi:hypothetical protein
MIVPVHAAIAAFRDHGEFRVGKLRTKFGKHTAIVPGRSEAKAASAMSSAWSVS